jgi:hypothetical protein
VDDDFGIDPSFRREVRRIFPETPLVENPVFAFHFSWPLRIPERIAEDS